MNCVPPHPLVNKVYEELLQIFAVLMSVCLVPKMLIDRDKGAKQANTLRSECGGTR
jgi:preprotein translocase subunit SecG